MEKKINSKPLQSKVQKSNSILLDLIAKDPETRIRIGIAESDEEVFEESRKRRLESPPSFEERIFLCSEI